MGNLEAAVKVANDPNFRLEIPVRCPKALASLMQDCWRAEPADRPDFHQIVTRLDEFSKRLLSSETKGLLAVVPGTNNQQSKSDESVLHNLNELRRANRFGFNTTPPEEDPDSQLLQ